MAWPNTPLTTYLAGGLPFIKAFDMNSLQSGINGIINATYSLKAVVIDGTGGAIVVPVAGTAKLSATASAAAGAGAAVAWGLMYKEAALFAHARIGAAGNIISCYNVQSVAHVAASGVYNIVCNGKPTNEARTVAAATPNNTPAGAAFFANLQPPFLTAGDLTIDVRTFDTAGAPTDTDFDLLVFGG